MKKILLLLVCFIALKLDAQLNQLNFSKDTFYTLCNNPYVIDSTKLYIDYKGTEKLTLFWKLNRGTNFDPKLNTQICDINLCYLEGVVQNSKNKPNDYPSYNENGVLINPTLYSLYIIDSFDYKGCDTMYWDFYSDKDFKNKFKTIVVFVGCCNTSSTNDQPLAFSFYPNPIVSNSILNIASADVYKGIEIHSLYGQKLLGREYDVTGNYDVGALNTGTYILKILGNDGKFSSKLLFVK